MTTPSRRIVEQRIRNRVIEYLKLASSFQAQHDYELAAPIAHIPYEVINQWKDWVPADPRHNANQLAVYSADEVEALGAYQMAWELASRALSDDYPALSSVQALPAWKHLRSIAKNASEVFARRGPMPEDDEVQ